MNEAHPISFLESIILGFVQGLTEFLPISSSGHLVIMQNVFGIGGSQVLFDITVHGGTLLAIFLVFKKDLAELSRTAAAILTGRRSDNRTAERMVVGIAVGTVPTAVIGVAFSEQFHRMFASMTAAGVGLLVTGVVLLSTVFKVKPRIDSRTHISFVHALIIGTAQGLAIIPGISRSGTTIAVALALGVDRELAVRFSFLLAVPAIVGAMAFEMKGHLFGAEGVSQDLGLTAMFSGAAVAAVTGVFALRLLLGVVRQGRISWFAYYCWVLGIMAIVLGLTRG